MSRERVSIQGVSVQGGLSTGNLCQLEVSVQEGVSIQVVSVWGSQSRAWGSLFRGVSVQRKEVSV